MWSTLIRIILTGAAVCGNPVGEPFIYDQRQTGKTNVRVEVKDAVVIAIGDSEFGGDYDYSYDYSDLTIKPPPFPMSTKEPVSTTHTTRPPTFATAFSQTFSTPTSMKTTTPQQTMKTTTAAPVFNATKSPIVLEAENNSIIFPSKKPDNSTSEGIKLPPSPRPDQIPVLVLQELLGSLPYKFNRLNQGPLASRVPGRPLSTNGAAINPESLPRRNCSPGYFLDNHNRCKKLVPKQGRMP